MYKSGRKITAVWKIILVLGLAWAWLPLSGTDARAADVKIGFINMQEAVSGTKEFKNALTKFKADFEEEKKRIALKEQRVQKLLEEINKQSFVLDPKLKQKNLTMILEEKTVFYSDASADLTKLATDTYNRMNK